MALKAGCIDAKVCMSERKIMKIIIALKKHVFHHGKLLFKKTPFPELKLSPHCMYAALPIARDGHLRRNTLVNLESAFTRLMTVENSDTIPVFQTKSRAFDLR